MNPLEAALRQIAAEDGFDVNEPLPEAVVAGLKEIVARYVAGCSFRVGDLVTPREGYGIVGAGRPGVVIEVLDRPRYNFQETDELSSGSSGFGRRLDVRIVTHRSGEFVAFWAESWEFEPYAPDDGETV